MPAFSKTSLDRLATCHPLIQEVMHEVIKYVDCMVIEGHRDKEAQNRAFREGKSKVDWPHGKHNTVPSNAIDIAPCPLDWNDSLAFARLAGYVQAVGDAKGIRLRWGGDWDRDGQSKDERFLDLVHLELC